MTPSIGFILLTHSKSHQISRLVTTLNSIFDHPPIVRHHDFSKSYLRTDDQPKNISFVHPHLETDWGRFSVVEATFSALQLMHENLASPDWIVLLSGADYPIKPAKQILQDLASTSYDVHINHEQINYNDYKRDWQELCYYRYCCVKFPLPRIIKKLTNMQEIALPYGSIPLFI